MVRQEPACIKHLYLISSPVLLMGYPSFTKTVPMAEILRPRLLFHCHLFSSGKDGIFTRGFLTFSGVYRNGLIQVFKIFQIILVMLSLTAGRRLLKLHFHKLALKTKTKLSKSHQHLFHILQYL